MKGASTLLEGEDVLSWVYIERVQDCCSIPEIERQGREWYNLEFLKDKKLYRATFEIYSVTGMKKTSVEGDGEKLLRFHIRRTPNTQHIQEVLQWVEECSDKHGCVSPSMTPLPTRILDLTNPRSPKLIHSGGLIGKYTTLSYCWGDSKFVTTTKDTMRKRESGIHWDVLPKTFQDAIEVTVQLGIRYLWIDALCIIQDDHQDWEKESGNMHRVYADSFLTISATRARTPIEGFLGSRSPAKRINLGSDTTTEYIARVASYHLQEDYPGSPENLIDPLLTRGWGYQERRLSPRTLYFTLLETIFTCHKGLRCECYGRLSHSEVEVKDPTEQKLNLRKWMVEISEYSALNLTYEVDRLPALSGLAQKFSQFDLGRYYAGIWEADLPNGLFWSVVRLEGDVSRAKSYVAPSWSWISCPGRHQMISDTVRSDDGDHPMYYHWICEPCVVEVQCTPSGKDPFGAVSDGYIKIHALSRTTTKNELAKAGLGFSYWYDIHKECFHDGETVTLLGFRGRLEGLASNEVLYYGMLVKESGRVEDAFERLGCLQMSWDLLGCRQQSDKIWDFLKDVEPSIVTLV